MESFRTRLNFVRTSVLSSTDGGNTYNTEKEVERKDEVGENVSELFTHSKKQNNTVKGLTLSEQMKNNERQLEQEEKDFLKATRAPKTLEKEDLDFIAQVKSVTKSKQDKIKAEEERLLLEFTKANARKRANSINPINNLPVESLTAIEDEVVVVRKKKRRKK